ncbi:rSAM-partnered protein [Halorientalis sp. IM1011]|uniref:Htur_1727 family rSAM-partnered candidate RiPP n=1 Tax=Halorientalis sp. IM1011 TaxID=1932360 RepID=UPI00097CC8C8|nr:Htur_1727 family rSAM-partnered candidate RiPP [Halorientalis sp. IM1011]AQL43957.1 rSAM-partnered protein [Halorientalis sp. IM1011]
MVEKPERARVGDAPRDATEREWEVFVREESDGRMRYVGSVTAPDADVAYEQATKLFAWFADDVWLCPAEAVRRYSTHDLDEDADPVPLDTGDEPRTIE